MVQRSINKDKTDLIEIKLPLSLYHTNGNNNGEYSLSHICSIVPRLCITSVLKTPEQLEENNGYLQHGDIILAVGNIENPTYKELRDVTTAHKNKELPVKILRSDDKTSPKTLTVNVYPKQVPDSNRVVIGIGVGLDMDHPVVAKTIGTKKLPAPPAIPRGAKITAVDGTKITNFYQFVSEIRKKQNGRIGIEWRLDEQKAGVVAVNIVEGALADLAQARAVRVDLVDLVALVAVQCGEHQPLAVEVQAEMLALDNQQLAIADAQASLVLLPNNADP